MKLAGNRLRLGAAALLTMAGVALIGARTWRRRTAERQHWSAAAGDKCYEQVLTQYEKYVR